MYTKSLLASIGLICGISIYTLLKYKTLDNIKITTEIQDGWKIYTVPNIKLHWKTSSHEMISFVPKNNKLIKIFKVPEGQQITFTFFS